jgi:hypothetical protein
VPDPNALAWHTRPSVIYRLSPSELYPPTFK